MATVYSQIIKELKAHSDEEKKMVLPRFFKTGKGEYGEGDKFLGVTVPNNRKVAKMFKDASADVLEILLKSEWHECRLCALLILVEQYSEKQKSRSKALKQQTMKPEEVVQFYLAHTDCIKNWDLVDLSAPYILGHYLLSEEDHSVLYRLAESSVMWEQRIAVVSTLMLIRHGRFEDTMNLAEKFLSTRHDLMQKAVGWMLREVGKRDEALLVAYLEKHRKHMPRTMLRYAIEKFPPQKRKYFMSK